MTHISKKISIAVMAIVFVVAMCFSMVILPSKVYADTINVPGNYATIQAAINAANPGDTIIVAAGTYNESLHINSKNGLTIQGDGTLIQGGASVTTNYGNRDCIIFVENSPNVILNGLDIEGQNLGSAQGGTNAVSYGVIYEESSGKISNCTVSPNTISDSNGRGVALWDNANLTIEGCIIENYGRIGIFADALTTASAGNILNNDIKGPAYSGTDNSLFCYGIEIESECALVCNFKIEDNNIYNNFNGPAGYGVSESAGILIDGWDEAYGTNFPDSMVAIEGNNIYDNEYGIYVITNNVSYAHNNNISGNLSVGVYSGDANGSYKNFDATNNWWGDASGPLNATSNSSGKGNPVSDYVNFTPWLTNPVGYVAPKPAAPKPLTPEEQASLDLSIAEQVSIYGASNIGLTKTLYDNILGRAPDSEGLNDWVTALNEGSITLGDVVFGFVFSEELKSKISPASPEEFVTFLYKNVFDRDPDPDGYNNWVTLMQNGMTKEEVLLHFIDSAEFQNICEMFGLTP